MSLGLVGRKVGMTRIFAEDGRTIPVTVLDVSDNRVSQIKTIETDGYAAVQVAYGKRRASRITKPVAGHLAKAGVEPCRGIKEFRVAAEQAGGMNAGDAIGAGTPGEVTRALQTAYFDLAFARTDADHAWLTAV